MGRSWVWTVLAGTLVGAGCHHDRTGAAQPTSLSVVEAIPDTILGPADSVNQATALALAGDGTLVLLDAGRGVVMTRSHSGSVRTFARPGAGPGELRHPIEVGVWHDTIWVQNLGNARLEFFGLSGDRRGHWPLPPAALNGAGSVARDGRVAAGTMGVRDSSLAIVYAAASDREVQRLGTLLTPAVERWDLTGIHQLGRAGDIPPMFRNFARPVFAPDGLWLVLFAEGEVRRFDAAGRPVAAVPLDVPETGRIREEFQASSRRTGGESFALLNYVADAQAVGDDLWLLLNTPEGEPSVVVVIGRSGFKRRIVFPNITGASAMTFDPTAGRIYLGIAADGLVLRTSLPAGLP